MSYELAALLDIDVFGCAVCAASLLSSMLYCTQITQIFRMTAGFSFVLRMVVIPLRWLLTSPAPPSPRALVSPHSTRIGIDFILKRFRHPS